MQIKIKDLQEQIHTINVNDIISIEENQHFKEIFTTIYLVNDENIKTSESKYLVQKRIRTAKESS